MVKVSGFNILEERLPAGSGHLVLVWLKTSQVQIRLSKPRQTKLGDFRPPYNKLPARISINKDLHPIEFLITLAHELAHSENWQLNGKGVKPHGVEWKAAFREKLIQILDSGVLDTKFEDAIRTCYFKRQRLATAACPRLRRLYDAENDDSVVIRLDDIPAGSIFKVSSGKSLIKGEKLRTRYKCREIKSHRIYTVHSMTEIIEFKQPKL